MVRIVAILVAVLGCVPLLHGAGFDRRQVPAGAVWFVHLDVEAANGSTLGKGLEDLLVAQPAAATALRRAHDTLGVDSFKDIRGITVYGLAYSPGRGILIINGKVDRPRLEKVLRRAPGYRQEAIDGRDIRFWNEPGFSRKLGLLAASPTIAGAFARDDLIVIGPDGPAVVMALAVLEGKSPALPDDSILSTAVPSGSILCAAAVGLDQAKNLPLRSAIARQCQSGTLAFGERGGDAFVQIGVAMQTRQTALRVGTLLIQARAMAMLQSANNPELGRVVESLRSSVHGNVVEVKWVFSAADAVTILQRQFADSSAVPEPGKDQ